MKELLIFRNSLFSNHYSSTILAACLQNQSVFNTWAQLFKANDIVKLTIR